MKLEGPELVQLCLNGDDAAWAKLVEEYRSLVYSICNLSYMADQDADDLAQEAFVKIWMNLSRYDPKRGGLTSWIASLTRNLRIDRFRRNQHERITDSMDEDWENPGSVTLATQITDQSQSPHESALSNEVTAIVSRATEQVTPVMRDVVALRLFHELDNGEIAHRLRIPEGTVRSRFNRGRIQLAYLLQPDRAALGMA
ncbi:MAG TPA: sigma-70 family RNA polymerase sigma factor [Terracidiphilus sp.]|nr:sigma-70 family RNA polymerase sigma factor [Terracidiphilus sp.]